MALRIRQILIVATFFTVIILSGCASPLFLEPGWDDVYKNAALPPKLESVAATALKSAPDGPPKPATVIDPERPARNISLSEAVALALEHGTVGLQSVRAPGIAIDDLGGFTGQGTTGSDSIRVLSYQPARLGTAIEAGLSRFDPLFNTGMSWQATDEPTQGLSSFSNGHGAKFSTALIKPLSTGGVFGLTFTTDYRFLNDPPSGRFGVLNPSYFTRMQFGFEQPLWRDFGAEINQIRPSFPGSTLFGAVSGRPSSSASEGILISRLRFDQSRAELERNVNFLLLNVIASYWNLYAAYVNLYVNDQGLRQAHMAWTITKEQMQAGRVDNSQLSQALAQYEQFRGERMRGLGRVLESERNLRALIGLPVEDGTRLVPIDTPITYPTQPHWQSALNDALNLRPELLMARQEVLAKKMSLDLQKNALLPDLRLQATHTTVGRGSRLDGNGTFIAANGEPVTNNALRSLLGTHYNNWTTGLTMNASLGQRFEHAKVRDARLDLAQSYLHLGNLEQKAAVFLGKQYNQVVETSQQVEIRRRQRVAQGEQLEVRFHKYIEGVQDSPFEFLLSAQRQWGEALRQEYQAIVDYNIALATWDFAKGTIMQSCRVRILEGPLPDGVTRRAVDQEREESNRRTLLERQRPNSKVQARSNNFSVWSDHAAPSLLGLGQIVSETAITPAYDSTPAGDIAKPAKIAN